MESDLHKLLNRPGFKEVWHLWLSAHSGGSLPRRENLGMRPFTPYLENMLLYQWDCAGLLRCRVMGSNVQERVQFGPKDVNWIDRVCPDVVPASKTWWNGLYDKSCAGAMEYSLVYGNGDRRMGLALFMPVLSQQTEIQVLSFQEASPVYRLSSPTNKFVIGDEFLRTVYIEVSPQNVVTMGPITEHKRTEQAPACFSEVETTISKRGATEQAFQPF